MSWWFFGALALVALASVGGRKTSAPSLLRENNPPKQRESSLKGTAEVTGQSLRKAYAIHHQPDGRMIPLTKEQVDAKLAGTKEKVQAWKRAAARAEKGAQRAFDENKPNRKLREELEAVHSAITLAEKDVSAFLDVVTFKNDSSDSMYLKFTEQLAELEMTLWEALTTLKDVEEFENEE